MTCVDPGYEVSVAGARAYAAEALLDGGGAAAILAGSSPADQPDQGSTVCACFSVGAHAIQR